MRLMCTMATVQITHGMRRYNWCYQHFTLPLDLPDELLTSRLTPTERHRIIERVLRRINERIPVAYLTNRSWFLWS